MTAHRMFGRSFDSLPAIVAFTKDVFASERIDPGLRTVVDLAIEELFTNMVKYSTGSKADVRIEMTGIDRGVEVTLIDYDVDRFDVTARPDVDVSLPIEQRKPGGLGLHLIRRLLDSIQYEYTESSRQSRITFRKTGAASQAADQNKGG
jgi:anti-sigma regulatory factor (Ser/Thr protein kinase)